MLKSIPLFFFLDGAMNGVAGRIFGREECKNPAILDKLRGFFLTFFDFCKGFSWREFFCKIKDLALLTSEKKGRCVDMQNRFNLPWKRRRIERICSE